MLHYNDARYDFSLVSRALRYYYPIDIAASEWKRYEEHIATLKLKAAVSRKFNNGFYKETWMPFQKEVSASLGLPVEDVTYPDDPGYGAAIVMEEVKGQDFERRKLLCFFTSLLGPFYVIAGIDQSAVMVNGEAYFTYNLLTISPENQYEEQANALLTLIKKRFPDHRLLPFQIWSQVVEGISLTGNDGPCSVFEALFNEVLQIEVGSDGAIKNVPVVGDKMFGVEDWQTTRKVYATSM
ncbi:hypothetical protein GA0116948_101418 [Chitinophaga costaii]|uniref:Uncharacterized protein n=1 Tax=Chitinophaga costaii TaxID=1335309 RepID=A0A1C3ZJA6_9BACT|nr:hypothetical protein [Chitinophaga costaii]PUZ30393.1 hypothetical protein DCM91_02655 [Chitinophaga costaii]SCB82290.1 hypothetical protein GA0116948_101418 [Chitinophaga costaii]